jgi:hypothetical protein
VVRAAPPALIGVSGNAQPVPITTLVPATTGTRVLYAALCGAALLCVGIPFWLIPYHDVNLPSSLPRAGLLVVAFAAFAIRGAGIGRLPWAVAGPAAMVVGAVALRVAVEVSSDPTSHNLWPLELMIAGVVAVLWAGAGGGLGWLLARIAVRPAREEP